MKPFFITGLPRSRTAWLSVVFTIGDSFCFHEALRFTRNGTEMLAMFKQTGAKHVGNSDSLLPFFYNDIARYFPDAPIVIIERDPKEVFESLERVFGVKSQLIIDETLVRLESIRHDALIVDYSDLDNEPVLRKMWAHCLGDVPFNRQKWLSLRELNIQIDSKKYMAFNDFSSLRVDLIKSGLNI